MYDYGYELWLTLSRPMSPLVRYLIWKLNPTGIERVNCIHKVLDKSSLMSSIAEILFIKIRNLFEKKKM